MAHKPRLTPRQIQMAAVMAEGDSYKIMAYKLGVTEGTVKTSASLMFKRVGHFGRFNFVRWFTREFEVHELPIAHRDGATGEVRTSCYE